MAADDFRRRADAVRGIPLEVVMPLWDAEQDPRDRSRWLTAKGPISVTGTQFFNWRLQRGGGGAIDLVIHLSDWSPRQAVDWLWQQLGLADAAPPAVCYSPAVADRAAHQVDNVPWTSSGQRQPLRLPASSPRHFDRVRHYLHQVRRLSLEIVDRLHREGALYADQRGNAVFRMVAGQPPRTVGAELRGTTRQVWHGLAPGTRRDAGFFWLRMRGPEARHPATNGPETSAARIIVLCESAIDAISCCELWSEHVASGTSLICISTAGVRSDAPWLPPLLRRGYRLYCGFDNDDAGNLAASRMIRTYPTIQRLLPSAHDWNDWLRATR